MKCLVSLLLLAACSTGISSCGGVEKTPSGVINDGIEAGIRASGGDPADWKFGNGCSFNGSCSAQISLAAKPDAVIAFNRYVARDSRAFLKSEDRIAKFVQAAYDRDCFERFERPTALFGCVTRG